MCLNCCPVSQFLLVPDGPDEELCQNVTSLGVEADERADGDGQDCLCFHIHTNKNFRPQSYPPGRIFPTQIDEQPLFIDEIRYIRIRILTCRYEKIRHHTCGGRCRSSSILLWRRIGKRSLAQGRDVRGGTSGARFGSAGFIKDYYHESLLLLLMNQKCLTSR